MGFGDMADGETPLKTSRCYDPLRHLSGIDAIYKYLHNYFLYPAMRPGFLSIRFIEEFTLYQTEALTNGYQ